MIFQVSSNSFCFIPFHSMNELLHHTFLKEGIVIHLPMDWLDVGLWYNWRKGVTFILCVIRRNFIPYHSVQSSGQPRLAQPSLPGLGWRAIFTTPLLESKGGPEPSLSPQVPAQAPVIRLRGQMPSHGSPWAKTRWRQSQALLLQLPRDSSGFMGWEGSRICGQWWDILKSMSEWICTLLWTQIHTCQPRHQRKLLPPPAYLCQKLASLAAVPLFVEFGNKNGAQTALSFCPTGLLLAGDNFLWLKEGWSWQVVWCQSY